MRLSFSENARRLVTASVTGGAVGLEQFVGALGDFDGDFGQRLEIAQGLAEIASSVWSERTVRLTLVMA